MVSNREAKICEFDQIFEIGTHTLLVRVHTGMKKISIIQNLTISIDQAIPLQRYYPTDKFVHVYKSLWASLVAQWLKNLCANAGDVGSIPELGRLPREGNSNPV